MSEVSVIGLGNMGAALARALLDAGHSVTVWNRSPDKAAPLVAAGATLAPSAGDAVAASPATIVCLKSHTTTNDLLKPVSAVLSGKTIIDLSSGSAKEAEDLVAMLTGAGADWQTGTINAYPSGIGKPDTAILCGGPEPVWDRWQDKIRILGGASAHVGTTPAAVPALFAALFTARQGFMFGLIYGGAVCKRAGLTMEAYARQIPITLGMAGNYADLFMKTVPTQDYDDAAAPVSVYLAALDDVIATFEETGTIADFPALMRDITKRAMEKGLSEKELTVLVEMLAGDRSGYTPQS